MLLNIFEDTLARIEWFRVKNHLRITEKELRQKNVENLSPELRKERAKNITRLNRYWTKGLFPKNPDFFNKRVPYFKDANSTLCAMAYLIQQSGHQDVVQAVVNSNNHVYINDIDDGPVLDWIHTSGLTKEEAAKVQPAYGPCGMGPCPDPILINPMLKILPWIVGSAGFILLEWLSYKISSWVAIDNSKRRIAAWLYFTVNNVVLAGVLGLLTYIFSQRYWS